MHLIFALLLDCFILIGEKTLKVVGFYALASEDVDVKGPCIIGFQRLSYVVINLLDFVTSLILKVDCVLYLDVIFLLEEFDGLFAIVF